MKRWKLVVAILLLPLVVCGNSYLDSRTDYYPAARVKLGLNVASSGGLDDTTASRLFNEAATLILPINRGIKRITEIVMTYQENTYGLDTTLVGIEAVWTDSAYRMKSLKHLPISLWNDMVHKTAAGTDNFLLSRPSFYDYTDSQLIVGPVHTGNRYDTLKIMGWHRLADVDTMTTPTLVPEKYRHAILYHMVWNQARARQYPQAFVESVFLELNGELAKWRKTMTQGGAIVPTGQ